MVQGPGRAVLVTGASSGLGLEVARRLAARGWAVGLMSRDTARLNARAVRMTLDNLKCMDCGHTADQCQYQWDRVWGTNY